MAQFLPVKAADREVVQLAGYVTIGATGAITSATSVTPGFTVTRSGQGEYAIAFADTYNACLYVNIVHAETGATAGAGSNILQCVPTAVSGSAITFDTHAITAGAGAETNPSSGDLLMFDIKMRRSDYGLPSGS